MFQQYKVYDENVVTFNCIKKFILWFNIVPCYFGNLSLLFTKLDKRRRYYKEMITSNHCLNVQMLVIFSNLLLNAIILAVNAMYTLSGVFYTTVFMPTESFRQPQI